jgi:oligopeptidase B
MQIKPPLATVQEKILTHHGAERTDPWFWLREKEKPEVLEYLKSENAYTDAVLEPTKPLQEKLYQEMRSRIKEDDSSVPEKEDEYFYFTRYEEGGQYPLICRKKEPPEGRDETLLDVNQEAKGKSFFELGICENSPNHDLLAYSADLDGSEKYTIFVKDLKTGKLLDEKIPNTSTSFAWASDSKSFFYTVLDEHLRPLKMFHHILGQDPAQDRLVYEEKDPRFFVDVHESESGRYIYLVSHGNNMSEWYFLRSDNAAGEFKLISSRETDHEYDVTDQGERFLIRTNRNDARDFQIMEAPIERPEQKNWAELIAHEPGRLILDMYAFSKHIVIHETQKGIPALHILDLKDGNSHRIEFEEEAFWLRVSRGREYKTSTLRFGYTSLTTPQTVFDYDMNTRTRELKKRKPVLGTFSPADYVTERIYAKSHDGTEVPISLVHRKEIPLDGSAPLLLYGYGSYGLSIPPTFSSDRLSLLDRGFVFAIAHIRGGMELGYDWYLQGKLLHKKNTFLDFIACGEHLVKEKYTSKEKLIAMGGSAGGMLIGAVANMRPDLFHALIAHVPFVDVLNTMLDESLPLTTMEYNEWGNPQIEEYFDFIQSYSPYDNIEAKDYPHMLIVGGLNDPRVTYWEPAKWAAKLRHTKTDDNLLLLKIQMGSGHAGASGRFENLKEVSLDYAFALSVLGMA